MSDSNCAERHTLDGTSDFFEALFTHRPSKIIAIVFAIASSSIIIPFIYGIIWYDKYGSNHNSTLINKFVTLFCFSAFEWILFSQTIDICRYTFGALPENVCIAQIVLKNSIFIQTLFILDGILITRYIFIFWLKNPAAFNHDFWSLFLNLWIIGCSTLMQVTASLLPGRFTLYYYLCTGKNPINDQDIPLKSIREMHVISIFTLFVHIVIPLRIFIYKKMTVPAKPTMNFSFNSVITKESITDITSTLIVSILLASSTIIFTRANKIPLFEFNCYPNYLLEYYMRIVWPNILGLTSVVLIYYRNQKLLKAVKTKFQDYISNRHLKCC